MKKHFSFTLVELLGAMALIVILAGIAFSGYSYAMNKAKESATTSTIKQIETALNAAKIKAGYFPASADYAVIKFTVDSSELLKTVEFGSTVLSAEKNKKLFAEFKKIIDFEAIRQNLNDDGELEDGFGGKIYYRFPGFVNSTGIDIISAGADGFFGEVTDEEKYKKPQESLKTNRSTPRSYYYDGSERIADDISNF